MSTLAERFEAMVDRSGDHHLWAGALNPQRGTGRLKVAGRQVTAHRVAWELARGPVPVGMKVMACPVVPACVRIDHLALEGEMPAGAPSITSRRQRRAPKGAGSVLKVRDGVWKLTATGAYADGSTRRVYRTVYVDTEAEARVELARLVIEVHETDRTISAETVRTTFDDAVRRYLYDHLLEERGRDPRTADDYWKLHNKWFAPKLGGRLVRELTRPMFDQVFGVMRREGKSRSRMNQARSLYVPFFRWAVSNGITTKRPLMNYELPTSTHVSREIVPPEVEQVALLLDTAFQLVPDVAPLLVLDATTGMRRGELVGLRASSLGPATSEIRVTTAVDGKRVKTTKTRKERDVSIDPATMTMLTEILSQRYEQADEVGIPLAPDPYLFSLAADASTPMDPSYLTKRVAILKSHLGIENKKPETIALEDEALRLYRSLHQPRRGRTGPTPKGAMSLAEIGRQLGRSDRWAAMAIASAERREAAGGDGAPAFDGSVLALRKFTSSELLDAGFSVSAIAQRQGHGPQVLLKHYGKRRRSADRNAAAHLGEVVHRHRLTGVKDRH